MSFIFLFKWSTYSANAVHTVVIIKKKKERKGNSKLAALATEIVTLKVSMHTNYHPFTVNEIHYTCSKCVWGGFLNEGNLVSLKSVTSITVYYIQCYI